MSAAQSESCPDEAQTGEEGDADGEVDRVCTVLGQLEGLNHEPVDIDFGQEPGAKEADEQPEGGMGESSHGDAFGEPFDQNEEAGEDEAPDDSHPKGDLVGEAPGRQGHRDSRHFTDQQVDQAGDVDRRYGGEILHASC